MTSAVEQHTVLPPEEPRSADLQRLASALNTNSDGRAKLVGPDGSELTIPDEVHAVLREVVTAMSQGQAVSVAPLNSMLTTQQAADMLNISRPTLVKLLESGEIPFEKRSYHRRVRLSDVLDYERRSRRERDAILDEMTRTAAEDGTDDDEIGFMHTR